MPQLSLQARWEYSMHKDELEKAYWQALINSPQGRWLLKTLLDKSGCLLIPNRDHSAKDNWFSGRRDLVYAEIVLQIVKHFGWSSIDMIMRGTGHVSSE